MKAVYALTLAILGAEAYVLPAGAAPKANYALRPSTNNAPVSNGGFTSPNKNAAGTKIKFTPGGSSGGKSGNVVPGFIAPSKRSKSGDDGDDYEVGEGAQKNDDDDEQGVMFTTFSTPHFKIGTPKQNDTPEQDDAADTKERKFKTPSHKKQSGKKQKQTDDDDSATKTDDSPKTSASAKPKKDDKKAAKQTEKEKKAAAKQAEKDKKAAAKQAEKDKKAAAKQAEKDKKKEAKKTKAEDKKKKPSSDDDDDDDASATKTDDDQPKATAVAKKASHKSHSHSS